MEKSHKKTFSRLEMAIAFSIGLTIGTSMIHISRYNEQVRIFREENKPSVMRIYNFGADVLMLDVNNNGIYDVSLLKYLSTIEGEADRNLERARIEKLVEWYD